MEAEGTLGHARPSTDHERRGMADGGARVLEVLTGVVTEPLEPLCGSVSPATCKACFLGSTLEPGRRPTLALRVARASSPIDVPLQALLQTQLRLPLNPRQHCYDFLKDPNLAATPHNLEIYNPKNNPTAGYVVLPRYP